MTRLHYQLLRVSIGNTILMHALHGPQSIR